MPTVFKTDTRMIMDIAIRSTQNSITEAGDYPHSQKHHPQLLAIHINNVRSHCKTSIPLEYILEFIKTTLGIYIDPNIKNLGNNAKLIEFITLLDHDHDSEETSIQLAESLVNVQSIYGTAKDGTDDQYIIEITKWKQKHQKLLEWKLTKLITGE